MSEAIILIGGGNFEKEETLPFDQKALSLTQKAQPKVLIIPAAMNDDQGYGKRLKQYFRKLGAIPTCLRLWHTKLSKAEVHQMFQEADLIYLGAGSTKLLLEAIRIWELEDLLKQCAKEIVVVGISAGANVLCDYGYSDTSKEQCEFIKGIGIVPCAFTPHAQKTERQHFDEDALFYDGMKIKAHDLEAYIYQNKNLRLL